MCSGCSSPCPPNGGHPVVSSLSATGFTYVQFPLRFPSKTPAFLFLSGCSLNTDWDVTDLLLILNYLFNSWGNQGVYCNCLGFWNRENIPIPNPSHLTNTHDLYWSGRKLAGLGRASALLWTHSPAYNAMGAG